MARFFQRHWVACLLVVVEGMLLLLVDAQEADWRVRDGPKVG